MNNLGTNGDISARFDYLQSLAALLQNPGLLVCDWSADLLGIAEFGLTTHPNMNYNQPGSLSGGAGYPCNLGRTMTHVIAINGPNLGLSQTRIGNGSPDKEQQAEMDVIYHSNLSMSNTVVATNQGHLQ